MGIKKLILLLLFIPLFAFAQAVSSITYKDVMSIDSKDTFLKIMVENKYSTTNTSEYSFALNPDEYGSSTSFAQYFLNNRFYSVNAYYICTYTVYFHCLIIFLNFVIDSFKPMKIDSPIKK